VWRLSGVCGSTRERVASFRRYCTIFFQKKVPSEKRDQDVSLNKETKKREATAATLATFLARMSKSENILLNCFDQDQNSLDKYF